MADVNKLETALEEQIVGVLGDVEANLPAVRNSIRETTNTTNDIVDAVIQQGESKTLLQQQELQTQLATQKRTQQVFEAAGGDDRIVELTKRKRQATDEAFERLDEIQAKEEIEFLENPIDWIAAQFTIKDDARELRLVQAEANMAEGAIQSITSRTTGAANAINATENKLTDASISANADLLAAGQIEQANKAKLEAVKTNANMLGTALQLNQAGMNVIFKQLQLEDSKQARKQRADEHKLSIERFAIVKDNYTTDKASKAALISAIRNGQALLNKNVQSVEEVSGFLDKGGQTAAELLEIGQIGASSTGQVGETAADSYFTLSQHNASELSDKNNPGAQVLVDAAGELQKFYQQPESGGVPKGKDSAEKIKTDYRTQMDNLFAGYDALIAPTDGTNPNKAAPLEVLGKYRSVAETALYQNVLKDVTSDGSDPEELAALGVAAFQKKEVNFNELVTGLTAIYQAAAMNNNIQQKRNRYNLPMQTSYKARVTNLRKEATRRDLLSAGTFLPLTEFQEQTPPNALPSFVPVDMMDQTEVTNYVTQLISNSVGPDAANFTLE